jgi:hypothetical protein
MSFYSSTAADRKPPEITIISSTLNWRAWWRLESARVGTDWRTLIECAEVVLSGLRIEHLGAPSS